MQPNPRRSKKHYSKKKSGAEAPREALAMEQAICRVIRSIPRGKVATYGQVAEAAGYPRYHRQVAQVLGKYGHALPWQRVLGAGGLLKTSREDALDQHLRLEMEGVRFRGRRVDMQAHGFYAKTSERTHDRQPTGVRATTTSRGKTRRRDT